MTKKYIESIKNISWGEYNMDNKQEDLDEGFDESNLSEEKKVLIDKLIREVESTGFKEKCLQIVAEKEKKTIHIGRVHLNRVACLIITVIIISSLGGVAYAAVLNHINSIEVKEMGNHGEASITYNNYLGSLDISKIERFNKPVWIPDGYYVVSEMKSESIYSIIYQSDIDELQISYHQYLPQRNINYSTENGKHEKVAFDRFSGEYIETEGSNYLIVTDGTYLYSIIADDIDKLSMIQMLSEN